MKQRLSLAMIPLLFIPALTSANPYFGVKAGTMQVVFDDVNVDSSPTSLGITLGYRFDTLLQGLSGELEITRGISSGEVIGVDLDVESQGLYVAYQTPGQVYLKGRLGYMNAALSAEQLSEDEGGETYGVALGARYGAWAAELDFTSIDDDVNYLSLGVVWSM